MLESPSLRLSTVDAPERRGPVTGLVATDARHFEGTMSASGDGSDPPSFRPKDLLRIVWEGIERGRLFVLPRLAVLGWPTHRPAMHCLRAEDSSR